MKTRTRFILSMLFGVLAGGAVTAYAATVRAAALAAAAARTPASQHVSADSALTAGFVVTTLAVGLLTFAVTSIRAYWRYRRGPLSRPARRGYSDYGGTW
jgi:hypothetical protein